MDPFEAIDPFLHELVLQHFDVSDVLKNLSFVSVEWCQITGKSKKCMNKIRLMYQAWRHQFFSSTEVFRCVQESCRRYQHVSVELGVSDDSKQFWNFIESCCKSLVTLKVENISRPHENIVRSVQFPNLEVYVAYGLDVTALISVLKSTRKLKNIFISSSDPVMDSIVIKGLISCFQNNRNLEEIYLKNVSFVNIFERPLEIKFHLKSLKLMNSEETNSISSTVERNLLNFLNQQSSTLKTFFFEFSSEKVLEYTFNNLPALTSTGLLNVPTAIWQRNDRITNLEIPYVDNILDIKKILLATPNLESLFVGRVTIELVDYLAWRFMKLKYLNYKFISLDVEEHYEELKVDHPEVNQDIDIWDYENVDWD